MTMLSAALADDGKVTLEAGLGWVYRAGAGRALVPGDQVPELMGKP